MSTKFFSTKKMVTIAVLSALATIVMFFEFPVLPTAPFLKVDFSDVITIVGGISFGPIGGTLIAFIRSIANWLIKGSGVIGLVGNFSGFLGSLAIMLPIVLIKSNRKIIKAIISIISLIVVSALVNYFFLMPIYMNLAGMNINMPLSQYILTIVIPFNLIKGFLVTAVTWVVYQRLADFLKRQSF